MTVIATVDDNQVGELDRVDRSDAAKFTMPLSDVFRETIRGAVE